MRYLLDAHAVIWYLEDSPHLSPKARSVIDNSENGIYICKFSLWEIAIKMNLDKLKLKLTFNELLNCIKMGNFDVLQIEDEHLKRLADVPFLHRDPFDRMLISTALAEGLTIITVDNDIHKYDVPWIW
ncbi:MAG: type II toxin-antitoxin system VapC family toxin [Chitinispirillales bacterium]|jgi:PIN domain nuclease of toxin-antitoxin system|nr:type II toxin-antitoxin system VapC family toxin [Chitinispirillales bacterium]